MTHHSVTVGEAPPFAQDDGDTLLQAALRAGVPFPYECSSGGCGACKFEPVSGEVHNLWPEAPGLTERDRRRGLQLACQCQARSDVQIKVRLAPECAPAVRPARRTARLLEARPVTHDITEFRFATTAPARFQAGQYAQLYLPGVAAPRSYSMSNLPNEEGEWHFMVRRVAGGKASAVLFEFMKPGDEIALDGPYGMAGLRTGPERDIVCVAGGSGLAPMLSIARGAAAAGLLERRTLHFFYGARTPRDVCGEAFLEVLPGFGGSIRYVPVVSQSGTDAWNGKTGFVHEAVVEELGERLASCEFYLAGPPPMTQALQETLMLAHKVPFERIHFDRFF
ncbi:MAG TPA: 2Fe-2S iron-sulfur cluster-binding protein [Telluria sp.]|nr:2Fe-2S iron-sulfur cluster-binding protein [Telluria sp.]